MTNKEKLQELFPNMILTGTVMMYKPTDQVLASGINYNWLTAEYEEPTTKNNAVDCISRVDALSDKGLRLGEYHFYEDYTKMRNHLKSLPSVTPQEPFINKPCISTGVCEHDKNVVLNKIRAEIEDTLYVDSLIFGELIDFRNGKISADDVIEEFNRVTRLEVLKIIDKYNGDKER